MPVVGTDLAEIGFAEGMNRVLAPGGGWPAATRFRLSQAPLAADAENPQVGELYRGSLMAFDLNEVTGTGYAALDVATPTPANGIIAYDSSVFPLSWRAPSPSDWSSQVWSLVASDANNVLMYAWSIVSSPLSVQANAGASAVTVADASYFAAGAQVRLGAGATFEQKAVLSVAGNVVTFTSPLAFTHAAGARATCSTDMSVSGKLLLISPTLFVFLQNVGAV